MAMAGMAAMSVTDTAAGASTTRSGIRDGDWTTMSPSTIGSSSRTTRSGAAGTVSTVTSVVVGRKPIAVTRTCCAPTGTWVTRNWPERSEKAIRWEPRISTVAPRTGRPSAVPTTPRSAPASCASRGAASRGAASAKNPDTTMHDVVRRPTGISLYGFGKRPNVPPGAGHRKRAATLAGGGAGP